MDSLLSATEAEIAELRREEAESKRPFNPRTEVSADAQFLWKRIFIWFWAVPVIAALLVYLVAHS